MCGATRHHALQHRLELIKGRAVGRADEGQRRIWVLKSRLPVHLDQLDGVRARQSTFVGDRCVERGEIDHALRLCAKHEWIVADAIFVNFRRNSRCADIVETFLWVRANAAVEQVRCHHVDRILQPAPHCEHAADAIVGIARRPEILFAYIAAELARNDAAARAP